MNNQLQNVKQYGLLAYCLILLTIVPVKSYADSITGLTLINATKNTDIKSLTDGETINLSITGNHLNVRATTNPSVVGKVVFSLDGNPNFRTEQVAPYSLAGDTNGDYYDWTPSAGTHTLTATPYSPSGSAGPPLTITFIVVSGVDDSTSGGNGTGQVVVQGDLRKWHKITLSIDGPATSETASTNPFLAYRLNVTFTNGQKQYVVPGYFAADGNAGETSAGVGNRWKVHFAPDETGTWSYAISMRTGADIAVSDDPAAGTAVEPVDGKSGTFTVSATDKTGQDLRAKGRLRYVGGHHLQFAETGDYFLKAGVDSPENFLAYQDFDNTPDNGGRRKTWGPHVQDWRPGDPTWKDDGSGGKGKGIIGAINYLASQGLNVFSFLTMNIGGDDQNVNPYLTSTDYTRFDCSKLDQWQIVFDHADQLGMYLHVKTQETENDKLLDGGDLGVQRKLYYRELIARFSYHLALNWNVGEENGQTDAQRKAAASYFHQHDPYQHPVVIHTYPGQQDLVYTPLLGPNTDYTGASIQTSFNTVYQETRKWVQHSANAGKKWVVANDEQGDSHVGVACDADYPGNRGSIPDNQNDIRKEVLWGNLMASGAGVEYYFGYNTGETDLSAQDFRSRSKMWRYTRHALDFFKNHVPLPDVSLLTTVDRGWGLGKEGHLYVVYLKEGGSANLTINTNATYSVRWYDPRNGGSLQNGSVPSITGNGIKSIGNPPNAISEDWVALIRQESQPEPSPQAAYRINAGGGSYTTADGKVFSADGYASGGNTYAGRKNVDISNTTDDVLYRSERYGDFSYNLPVSNGTYTVILHFAEIYRSSAGNRKFNVDIEGQRKLAEFDIAAKAGGALHALQETVTTIVNDGTLTIDFLRGSADNPKVSAIEVIPSASTAASARTATMPSGDNNAVITTYPNPAAGSVTIDGINTQGVDFDVSLTNGFINYRPQCTITSSTSVQIRLDGISPGSYIVRIRQPGNTLTQKVIIRK